MTQPHPGTTHSPNEVMRYWRDFIKAPIENGQTPDGDSLQTFERQLDQMVNSLASSATARQ